MEECIIDFMKKLALWDTKTFKPITTHEELEPIMATLGFVVVRPSSLAVNDVAAWREYAYLTRGRRRKPDGIEEAASRSNPKLLHPKIDGLHVYMYKAFLDAVNLYLKMSDISDLFHLRWGWRTKIKSFRLVFMRIAAIKALVCNSSVYEYVKQNSRTLRSPVGTVEGRDGCGRAQLDQSLSV